MGTGDAGSAAETLDFPSKVTIKNGDASPIGPGGQKQYHYDQKCESEMGTTVPVSQQIHGMAELLSDSSIKDGDANP